MRAEERLMGQADAQPAQAQRRILFLPQVKAAQLLVRADVQRADDHRPFPHNLGDPPVSPVQRFLRGQGIPAQVEELAAHQADPLCVRPDGRLRLLRAADVGHQQHPFARAGDARPAAVSLQGAAGSGSLCVFGAQHGLGRLVRVGVPGAGEAVHRKELTALCRLKGDVGPYQRGDAQRPGQNGGMADGRALPGDDAPDPPAGQLEGLAGRQILRHQQKGALRQPETGAAAEDIIQPTGHIADIRAAGAHVRILHGRKHPREALPRFQHRVACRRAAYDGLVHAREEVRIIQHQQLNLHNGRLLLADLRLCAFKQGRQLRAGRFHRCAEAFRFRRRRSGISGRDSLRPAIHNCRAHGDARRRRDSVALLHSQLLSLSVFFPFKHIHSAPMDNKKPRKHHVSEAGISFSASRAHRIYPSFKPQGP